VGISDERIAVTLTGSEWAAVVVALRMTGLGDYAEIAGKIHARVINPSCCTSPAGTTACLDCPETENQP